MRNKTFENEEELKQRIKELRDKEMSYKSISITLHTKPTTIVRLLDEMGYSHSTTHSTIKINEDLNKQGFELVGAYINSDTPITIKCLECGEERTVTYHNVLSKYKRGQNTICFKCKKKEQEDKNKIKEEEQQRIKAYNNLIKQLKNIKKEKQKQIDKERCCNQCGAFFVAKGKELYCSDKCRKKFLNKKSDKRITRNGKADYTITLEKLYKRDKGICYLCKGKCDYEDYTYQGNTFIAGNYYPSIDHVIAIANGGLHKWDNVMLAHRICNTLKRDK